LLLKEQPRHFLVEPGNADETKVNLPPATA